MKRLRSPADDCGMAVDAAAMDIEKNREICKEIMGCVFLPHAPAAAPRFSIYNYVKIVALPLFPA